MSEEIKVAVEQQVEVEVQIVKTIPYSTIHDIYEELLKETMLTEMIDFSQFIVEAQYSEELYFTGLIMDNNPVYTEVYNAEVFLVLGLITIHKKINGLPINFDDFWFFDINYKYVFLETFLTYTISSTEVSTIVTSLLEDYYRVNEISKDITNLREEYVSYIRKMSELETKVLSNFFSARRCLYGRLKDYREFSFHGVTNKEIVEFLSSFIPYYREMTGDYRHFVIVNTNSVRGFSTSEFNSNYINIVFCTNTSSPYGCTVNSEEIQMTLSDCQEVMDKDCFARDLILRGVLSFNQMCRKRRVYFLEETKPVPNVYHIGDAYNPKLINVFKRNSSSLEKIYINFQGDFELCRAFQRIAIFMKMVMRDLIVNEDIRKEVNSAIDKYIDAEFVSIHKEKVIEESKKTLNTKRIKMQQAQLEYSNAVNSFITQKDLTTEYIRFAKKLDNSILNAKRPHNFIRITDTMYIGDPTVTAYHGGIVLIGRTRPYIFFNQANSRSYLIPGYKIAIPIPRETEVNSSNIELPHSSIPFILRLDKEFLDYKNFLKLKIAERNGEDFNFNINTRSVPPIFPHLSGASVGSLNIAQFSNEVQRFILFINPLFGEDPGAPVHTVCLGAKGVANYIKALRTGSIPSLIHTISLYLFSSINMNDSWGSNVYNFPVLSLETMSNEEAMSLSYSLSFSPENNDFWTSDIEKWDDYKYELENNGDSKFTYWDLSGDSPQLRTVILENNTYVKQYYELNEQYGKTV